MDLGSRASSGPGSEGPDLNLPGKSEFDLDMKSVEKTTPVVNDDPQVKRVIGVDPGRCPKAQGQGSEILSN
tara:strand:+ start:825 stop:1037 length:213 start_codon:yes stop_codon:yes gene_type:complete